MAITSCLLHLEMNAWQVFATEPGSKPSERQLVASDQWSTQADKIVKSIRETNTSGKPIVVGLGDDRCLPATLQVASPQMMRKPQLMHYQLEESIPWSAEEYVSDFISHRTQAFSVATRHGNLTRLLKQLEEEGLAIAAVTPLCLLAVADHLKDKTLPSDHVLFWQFGEHIETVLIRQRMPVAWCKLRASGAEVLQYIRNLKLSVSQEPALLSRSLNATLLKELEAAGENVASVDEGTLLAAACRSSLLLSTDQEQPLIDLQQGPLKSVNRHQATKREVGWLKIAASILLVCCAVGFWLRSEQYRSAAATVTQELAATYVDLFPEKANSIPARVGPAIEKQLRVLRGTRSPSNDLPKPIPADVVLNQVLTSLPTNLRFRLPEIHIEQDKVSLGAEVRTNADADKLASALRENDFTVSAPRTRRLADRGFGVRLSAQAFTENKPQESP